MNDFFDKFNSQNKINEGLFDKIFQKSEKKEQNPDFYQAPNGAFVFGGKNVVKQVNNYGALPFLKQFDWTNSKLNFLMLPGTEFVGTHMEVDLKNQTIKNFEGTWKSGPFYGGIFEGKFKGSSFQGEYIGRYTDYESHPTTFIDGTFLDTTNSGILGIANMVTLHKARNRRFHLIAIPAGYYLQFRSVNGISGYIKILKRLNEVNSDFKIEILDGFKGEKEPRIIDLPWNYFRQNWNDLFVNPKNPKSIAGLIQIPSGDIVKEMYISTAPATFKTSSDEHGQEQYELGKKYEFNLSKIPYLNIKSIKGDDDIFVKPDVELEFYSQEEFEKFKEILSYINSGVLKQDIKNIAIAIKYGEIDGYGAFNYLSKVFDGIKGDFDKEKVKKRSTKIKESNQNGILSKTIFKTPDVSSKNSTSPILQQTKNVPFGTVHSMQRLSDFVRFFVENIINSKGEANESVQDLIINRLKEALDIKSIQKSAQIPPVPPGGQNEPGMSSDDIASFKAESIRSTVRNIINDSF